MSHLLWTWPLIAMQQVPPGFEEAIRSATVRGWEAVVLVILIISGFGFFAYMFRSFADQARDREQHYNIRVTGLEDMIRERLFSCLDEHARTIREMTAASGRLIEVCVHISNALQQFELVLENRPCMAMDAAMRLGLVDKISEASLARAKKALARNQDEAESGPRESAGRKG